MLVLGLSVGLAAGCGGGRKSVRLELTAADLAAHRHVLVVGAGPALVKLEAGLAGKVAVEGLNRIVEADRDSDFASSLQQLGLVPRETALEEGGRVLEKLGWQVSLCDRRLESPGKKYKKFKPPAWVCQQAAAAGADSALVLHQLLVIDVGATESLARSKLRAYLVACPEGRMLWRDRDGRKLSLNRFILQAAQKVVSKEKKTLEDFLGALRALVQDACREVLTGGMSR